MIRESAIERYFVQLVTKVGGRAYKFVSPGNRGVPDRIAVFPGGRTIFVELKSQSGKLSAQQEIQHKTLRALGCEVFVVASIWDAEVLICGYIKI